MDSNLVDKVMVQLNSLRETPYCLLADNGYSSIKYRFSIFLTFYCSTMLYVLRDTPIPTSVLYTAMQRSKYIEHENGEAIDWSNFVDLDWLSSSANSCEEELLERSMLSASPTAILSSDNVINEIMARETTSSASECGSSTMGREHTGSDLRYGEARKTEVVEGFSDIFVHWVMNGETLYH